MSTEIITKGLTPERAKLLYSMLLESLPGVDVPDGGRDPSDFDGTRALRYIYQVWASITPEQQQAVSRLVRGKSKTTRRWPVPGPRDVRETGWSRVQANLGSSLFPTAYATSTVDDTSAFDYQALLDTANGDLAVWLKQPPISKVIISVDYGTAPPGKIKGGTAAAVTDTWFKLPLSENWWPEDGCAITLFNQQFVGLSQASASAILTHEVFHCYQQRAAGDPNKSHNIPEWILEGEANWAAAAVVPTSGSSVFKDHWQSYIDRPGTQFSDRVYDGMGVFGHLSDLTDESVVWPKLLDVALAGAFDHNTNALDLLINGHRDTFFSSWGASYFRTEQHVDWNMTGPGSVPGGGPAAQIEEVLPDEGKFLVPTLLPYTAQIYTVTKSPDIVTVSLLNGYGRIHDEGFGLDLTLDTSGALALCVKVGGCTCPDGSPGASLTTKRAKLPLAIGLEAGDKTAQAALIGASLDRFCKQPDSPQPPGQTSGGGGGSSAAGDQPSEPDQQPAPKTGRAAGDSHITTFDGLHYDFQVVGEYTLVKSTKDDFIVQARQVPVHGSTTASIIQAIATKVNGHRVTISIEDTDEALRIDGKNVFGAPPSLNGAVNCTATMYGKTCLLTWPDGTTVRATQVGSSSLDVTVQPAKARLGALAGLLGDANDSPADDLVGIGGTPLGGDPNRTAINHSLADAWRISQAASLFDYQADQSTRTFTDPAFPSDLADAGHVANREAAENACRQEGVTEPRLLDDCILDFAVTNNFAYTSAYGHAQRVMNARSTLALVARTSPPGSSDAAARPALQGNAPSSANAPPALSAISGQYAIKIGDTVSPGHPAASAGFIAHDDRQSYSFVAQAGAIVYIKGGPCVGDPVWLELHSPDNSSLGATLCADVGPITLYEAGTYQILAHVDHHGSAHYAFSLLPTTFDRYNIKLGDSVSRDQPVAGAGSISKLGERQSYSFSGQAGQIVWLGDRECKGNLLAFELLAPSGSLSTRLCGDGPGQRQILPDTGTYQIVARGQGLASYSFEIHAVPADEHAAVKLPFSVGPASPAKWAGHIASVGTQQFYDFTATPGSVVHIESTCSCAKLTMLVGTQGGQPHYYDLETWSKWDWTLPPGGKYAITVFSQGFTGDYSFTATVGQPRHP